MQRPIKILFASINSMESIIHVFFPFQLGRYGPVPVTTTYGRFTQDPDLAPRNITAECKEQVLENGILPEWIWTATDVGGNVQTFIGKDIPA